MTTAVAALLPFVSVLAGAALTYWLNVRQRSHDKAQDVLRAAIAAVAAMQVSTQFATDARVGATGLDALTTGDLRDLSREVTLKGLRVYFESIASARLAVAEASAYFDGLEPFGEMEPSEFTRRGEELRTLLVAHLAPRRRPRTEASQ
ncbi:hypothetical protein GCM10022199_16770 [Marihabitans asiaticum]|uniref:Uncharacterized protein n=1 Tax=Marihabitans asiaticum TaxID=415218 RepID=A0A560W7P9_9MICO|nr:hypothetical protein [Marihabitans asiaticum]TWD13642.1 hypothetical protein FB557_2269 [Marihabitans asiaticum]